MTRTSASAIDLHAKSMRNHVQTLGAKSYQSQFEEAPDYVVMFVPGEHFVAAALEHDPELWDFAFERGAAGDAHQPRRHCPHRGAGLAAGRDGERGARDRPHGRGTLRPPQATAAEHLKRVGGGLETAVNNYNKFVGSFERNVLTRIVFASGCACGMRRGGPGRAMPQAEASRSGQHLVGQHRPATAALRLSARPRIGMVTRRSQAAS
jgi:hypothetical protein